ncbi:hypothetical protein QTO34_008135 [Cnephaeus nilssonii]|uniref:Lymphoid enhancer-binding factor 1 n=1 Tax=Cnephaeus nilssonii TaxID=3371016 RepID=A0AA40IA45_CNENI|nr:hypothetical protein QTO34_008135 [Eptesicus nilssonii]
MTQAPGDLIKSNKVPVVQPSHAVHPLTPLITYSDEHFSPGSHPSHIPSDVNSKQGMSRHPPAPEIPTFYPLSPGGVGQITPPLGWFSHHMIPGPPGPHTTGIPHPAIVTPQVKQEHPHTDGDLMHVKPQHEQRKEQEPKRPHIKKPLNAFMLYMKEMRANVVAECTLKESAAINQILGRRGKKKKRKREKLQESTSGVDEVRASGEKSVPRIRMALIPFPSPSDITVGSTLSLPPCLQRVPGKESRKESPEPLEAQTKGSYPGRLGRGLLQPLLLLVFPAAAQS